LRGKNADLEEKVKNLGHEIDNLVAENKALIETIRELKVSDKENKDAWDEVNRLQAENDRLRRLNQGLYDQAGELQEKLKEKSDPFHLTELCETLRKDIDRLRDEKIRSFETHTRVLAERDKLARENQNLKNKIEEITEYSQGTNDELASVEEERDRLLEENARLRDNMEQMKKIVGPADFEKEIEDLKSQLKKQTEITEDWRTDAMNHYRKYVNILDERAALQRKLADIEKIAKEKKDGNTN
jgi:predicted nuclease with TOPRIM domain